MRLFNRGKIPHKHKRILGTGSARNNSHVKNFYTTLLVMNYTGIQIAKVNNYSINK